MKKKCSATIKFGAKNVCKKIRAALVLPENAPNGDVFITLRLEKPNLL